MLALGAALIPCVAVRAAAPLGGRYYTVQAQTFNYNLGSGDFTVPGHVTLRRPGLEAAADNARGNVKAGKAELHGNVRVHDVGGKGSPQGANAEPATLTSDDLYVDGKADTYRATGHASYDSRTRHAKADTMIYDRKHQVLHLEGTVTVIQNDTTMNAGAIDVDIKKGDTTSVGQPITVTKPTPNPSATATARPTPSARPVKRPR